MRSSPRAPRPAARLALCAALCAALAACDDGYTHDRAGVPITGEMLPDTPAVRGPFHLERAYIDGEPWEYLDLGAFEPLPATMYVLTFGGWPLEGQWPVVRHLPGAEGYSPF